MSNLCSYSNCNDTFPIFINEVCQKISCPYCAVLHHMCQIEFERSAGINGTMSKKCYGCLNVSHYSICTPTITSTTATTTNNNNNNNITTTTTTTTSTTTTATATATATTINYYYY